LGYFPKYPLDFIFGKDNAINGHSDVGKAKHFIEQIQLVHQTEQLEKSKPSTKQDMMSIGLIMISKWEIKFDCTSARKYYKLKINNSS